MAVAVQIFISEAGQAVIIHLCVGEYLVGSESDLLAQLPSFGGFI